MKLTITKTGKLSKCTLAKGETTVIIDHDVKVISTKAFDSCRDKITKLVIGEGVAAIEEAACKDMTALSELVLPDSLVTIMPRAFEGCSAIEEIILPDGIKEIGIHAFARCENLKKLHLPAKLVNFFNCISGCKNLTSIEIPASVSYIGYKAFSDVSMEEISLSEGVKTLDGKVFEGNTMLKKVSLPSGIKFMAEYNFSGCSALEEFTFPTELRVADFQKKGVLRYFENCTALKKVWMTQEQAKTYLKATAAQLKKDSMPYKAEKDKFELFKGCTALTEICFLAEDISRWNDGTCEFKTEADGDHLVKCLKTGILEYTVPDDVTVIEDDAFADNTRLKTLVLNDKIKRLNLRQFANCKLDKLTIPDTLTEIVNNDFSAMRRASGYAGKWEWFEIIISDTHPTYAVQDEMLYIKKDGRLHTLLHNMQPVRWSALVIPEGVEVLAPFSCEGGKYTEVNLPSSLRVIGERAFTANNNLSKVILPEGVEEIGNEAFIGCRSLTELRIPVSVVRFPKKPIVTKKTVIICQKDSAAEAYAKANALDAVCPTDSKTDVNSLFDWGYGRDEQIITEFLGGVEEVTLPVEKDGIAVKGYSEKLLDRVRKSVKRVVVPEGIERIPDKFFARCEVLTEVVLPSTLKSIGTQAFNGCYSLSQIEIPESVTEIGENVFGEGFGQKYLIVRGVWGSAAHQKAMEDGCRFVEIGADEQTQILQKRFLTEINEDGTLSIVSFFREDIQDCIIPEQIGGREVTVISHKLVLGFTFFDRLSLPKTIRKIEKITVRGIKQFEIDPENPYFKSDDKMWYSCGGKMLESVLSGAHSDTELHIPQGVEVIREDAFSGCHQLQRLYIPDSVRIVCKSYENEPREAYYYIFHENKGMSFVGSRGGFAEMAAHSSKVVFLPQDESEEMHALREKFMAYRLHDDTLALRGYCGTDSEVYIPDEIAGSKVSEIIEWECGGNLPKVLHIPDCVRIIEPIHLAEEAVCVSENHPVYYSEDGKLYKKSDKTLISFPKKADHTRFWAEMQVINEGMLDDIDLDELRIPEGVKKWNCVMRSQHVKRLILPRSLEKTGIMCAEEVVLHASQLLMMISCVGCGRVTVLDEQENVCAIFCGAAIKPLESAAWGQRYHIYMYQELESVVGGKIQEDSEITLEMLLRWYDAQFDKLKNSADKIEFAMYRLRAPHRLSEGSAEILTAYLRRTVKKAVQFAIDANDITLWKSLLESGAVNTKNSQSAIDLLTERNMIEWTALLLEEIRKG